MSPNVQTFATEVLAAFAARNLQTDVEVTAAGGPSDTYMTGLRKAAAGTADIPRPRRDSARRIETAAGWPGGAATMLWETGELPATAQEARAVGPGRPPAPIAFIDQVRSSVRMDGDALAYRVTSSASPTGSGGEASELVLVFRPGPGQESDLSDLARIAGKAHRDAMAATYQREEREAHDRSAAATKTPEVGPAYQPTAMDLVIKNRRDYAMAANDDDELSIEAEQEAEHTT